MRYALSLALAPCPLANCIPTGSERGTLVSRPGLAHGDTMGFVRAPGRAVALTAVARTAQVDETAAAAAVEQAEAVGGTKDQAHLWGRILTPRAAAGSRCGGGGGGGWGGGVLPTGGWGCGGRGAVGGVWAAVCVAPPTPAGGRGRSGCRGRRGEPALRPGRVGGWGELRL